MTNHDESRLKFLPAGEIKGLAFVMCADQSTNHHRSSTKKIPTPRSAGISIYNSYEAAGCRGMPPN